MIVSWPSGSLITPVSFYLSLTLFHCVSELAHFTDSSTGSLVTLDRKSGVIQWEAKIGSPIVAMYKLEGEGIVSVPFTSVSKETLANLMEQFNSPESKNEIIGETKL